MWMNVAGACGKVWAPPVELFILDERRARSSARPSNSQMTEQSKPWQIKTTAERRRRICAQRTSSQRDWNFHDLWIKYSQIIRGTLIRPSSLQDVFGGTWSDRQFLSMDWQLFNWIGVPPSIIQLGGGWQGILLGDAFELKMHSIKWWSLVIVAPTTEFYAR